MDGFSEYEVISIPVSDGTEKEFAILDIFELEQKKYAAVSLVLGEEIGEDIYIYRYTEAEDGDAIVEQITLPAEFKKVTKAYEKIMQEQME